MMGDMDGTIIIADHSWYDFIKFYDHVSKNLPEEKIYLGQYLVRAINIGPAITSNILKSNGEVLHCSTYLSLLLGEVID